MTCQRGGPGMQSLVIDIGSGMSKCGFSGDDAPRAVFPTRVGHTKNPGIMVGMDSKDCFVGDEAPIYGRASRFLRITYPLDRGLMRLKNWNNIEKIVHHTFYNELRVTPEQHPVLVTEPTCNLRESREKMTKMLFEVFNVPAFYLASQSVLSLYATGKTTGLVLMSGHGFSECVPIYESFPISHACLRREIAGKDITEYLVKLICERGYQMTNRYEQEIVRDIKEKLCYIATDYDIELHKAETQAHCEHEYELPDGSKMTIGNERFIAPEALFNPSLIKSKEQAIHKTVVKSLKKVHINMNEEKKRLLYGNIVLSGGSTMFEGIVERLKDEILSLSPPKQNSRTLKIIAPAERKYSVWIGGSIMSSLSTFQNMWIVKDEYDDVGETIVHRKCFGWSSKLIELPDFQEDIHGDERNRAEFLIETYFGEEQYSICSIKFNSTQKLFLLPKILV